MSDPSPFPAPVLPWLPAPTPRVAAPLAAPPNPWARIAANENIAPTPSPRKRRGFPIVAALAVVLLLVAGGVAYTVLGSSDEEAAPQLTLAPAPTSPTGASSTEFAVVNDVFRFVLPATPKIENIDQEVLGISVTGTGFTVQEGDAFVSVVTMNLGSDLDEFSVQGGFDATTIGAIRRSNGTLVSDTWATTNGVYERMTVSSLEGGYLYQWGYAKGGWLIAIMGVGETLEPPSWYLAVTASFSFV